MSKTKSTEEQIEEILQEQIALLRRRAKECARQFNHQVYDDLTAQYIALETKLKTLIASSPKIDSPNERQLAMPDILGAPYELKNALPLEEDPYDRGGLWAYARSQSSGVDGEVSRLPETIDNSAAGNSTPGSGLSWSRLRKHHS